MKHCNHCDTDFANPSPLKRHISAKHPQTLNGPGIVKPQHRCSDCSKTFARNETLERHRRFKHTLELKRTCPFCLERFRDDYCILHEPRCSRKYWAKTCKNASYISYSGPARLANESDEGRLASSTEPKSLRVMHELVVDASLAAKSLHNTLVYSLDHDDVDSALEALIDAFLMSIHVDSDPFWSRSNDSYLLCLVSSIEAYARGEVHINNHDEDGFTLLHLACLAGATDLLEPLFWRGANFENTTKMGNTPLLLAVQEGHLDTIRFALALGADPDYDGIGTILACAISDKRHDIATTLIEHGADIYEIDEEDECFESALRSGEMEEVRFLLWLGIDPNRLMHSAFEVDILNQDVAEILIEHGADIDREADGTDSGGSTLLAQAVCREDLDKVRFIISLGASPNVGVALHLAIDLANLDIANFLAQSGANIDRPAELFRSREETPLCMAVREKSLESVRLAISLGADVNDGNLLDDALERSSGEIVGILLEEGAPPGVVDAPTIDALFEQED